MSLPKRLEGLGKDAVCIQSGLRIHRRRRVVIDENIRKHQGSGL